MNSPHFPFSPSGYRLLVERFLAVGYTVCKFSEVYASPSGPRLILRHDVDVDLGAACALARLESEMKVQSTYFVSLTSPFYNALSTSACNLLHEIHSLGHSVALHLDPHRYGVLQPSNSLLKRETRTLRTYLPFVDSDVFSVHRPSGLAEDSPFRSGCPINASSRRFFGVPFAYISDSAGRFRDSPFESEAFRGRQDIQLLTHPLWWVYPGDSPYAKLLRALDISAITSAELVAEYLPRVREHQASQD